ncbi:MAG: hypothetical protein JXB85_07005 [Anaerolineales bacterium]|nr:hypothetical protein [Anaerolineales bacterium]
MTWRRYVLLAVLGLLVTSGVAAFQSASGYMDADYYFAGGIQLVSGNGFSEPYIWNYLDDPSGVPHPSHAYWMPLASLLAAAGMALAGMRTWAAARIGFLVVAASLPPLAAALSYSLTSRRDHATLAGLLAVFSAFYLPYLPVTDTFGLYMLLGGLVFLVAGSRHLDGNDRAGLLGILAGLMHLARADGLLWLGIAMAVVFLMRPASFSHRLTFKFVLVPALFVLGGYLLVMLPWFSRNYLAFGGVLSPGSSRVLWLTDYNQLFAYPADRLTFRLWWDSGIAAIAEVRLWALRFNLANALSVQGSIFLLPLILVGFWERRADRRVQLAGLAWVALLLFMTLVFPFAGARGGFFHAGAALQVVWWALVPPGLERVVAWARRLRNWPENGRAEQVFSILLVGLGVLLSAAIVFGKVIGPAGGEQAWGREAALYGRVDAFLISEGKSGEDVVMAANPPGFYLASGNPAVAVPDGDLGTLQAVAARFNVRYVLLERNSTPDGLLDVFENPTRQAGLTYLGEIEEVRIFAVTP